MTVRWTPTYGQAKAKDVLLWTPTYGQAKAGRPARTYIQQLCEDTGCNPEDLPDAMNNRVKWRERVRDIRAGDTTWWWWWWSILALIWLVIMTLICATIRRNSVSLLRLTFLSHVHVFTPVLAYGLPLRPEWQQVYSSHHDSSPYSGRS